MEVGTAYGYSTLWLALGQPAGGTIVTIDPDQSRTDLARGWWREAGIADERITVVNAPALDAFAAGDPALAGPFDLVFIDALKPEYGAYVEALVGAAGARVPWSSPTTSCGAGGSRARDRRGRRREHERAARVRSPRSSPIRGSRATILPLGDGLLVASWRG